jgi:hypothetical protein
MGAAAEERPSAAGAREGSPRPDAVLLVDSVAALESAAALDSVAALDSAVTAGAVGASALVGQGITDMDMDTIPTITGILIRGTLTHTITNHTERDMRPRTDMPLHTDTPPHTDIPHTDTIRMRTLIRDPGLEQAS